MKASRHVLGIMTGTSLDGIDAALVHIEGQGLELVATTVRHRSGPLGPAADTLRRLARGEPMPASDWARAGLELAQSCAEIALEAAGETRPDLVAVHGQTIHHAPPESIQLLNPAPIVQRLGCPVVHDLRAADLSAGGQGAPITPIADWILFRETDPITVINLGGFCNVTHLPPSQDGALAIEGIQACDVCPCNHLLDAAARRLLDQPCDMDGTIASSGQPDETIAGRVEKALRANLGADRSLGSGDEGLTALEPLWQLDHPGDALASLVSVIAGIIIEHVPGTQQRILLAGGGARNAALVESIRSRATARVSLTDEVGVDAQAREAVAMAILGALAMDGVPVTLPHVTGSRAATVFDGSWCLPRHPGQPGTQDVAQAP